MRSVVTVVVFSFWIILFGEELNNEELNNELPNNPTLKNLFQCDDSTTCANQTIFCGEKKGDCTVNCYKALACSGTTVLCPPNAYCTVNCGKDELSCASINITATRSSGLTINIEDYPLSMENSNIYVVSHGRHDPSIIDCAVGNNSPCTNMNIHSPYGFADVELMCGKANCFASSVMHCGSKESKESTTCEISRGGPTSPDDTDWTCANRENACSTLRTPKPTVAPTPSTSIPTQLPSTIPSGNPTWIPTTKYPTTYAPTPIPTVIPRDGEVGTTSDGGNGGAKNEIDINESGYGVVLYGGIACAVLLFCCVFILIVICLVYKKKRKQKENRNKDKIISDKLENDDVIDDDNNVKIKVTGSQLPFDRLTSFSTPGDIDDENIDILLNNKNSVHEPTINEGNKNDHSDSEQLYGDKDKEKNHLNEQQQVMDGDPVVTGITDKGDGSMVVTPMTSTGGNIDEAFKNQAGSADNDKNDKNANVHDQDKGIDTDND